MRMKIVSQRLNHLGEGPHWDVATQKLYHVDAFVGEVCRLDPETGVTETRHLDGVVTFVIPYKSDPGNLLITCDKHVRKLNFDKGESEIVATMEESSKARFNDGKCDPRGICWTGTIVEGTTGHLYRLDANYKFKAFADNIILTNGLAWSLDTKKLYYIDSEGKKIYVFDYNLEEASASNQEVLIDFATDEGYQNLGVPDGMTIDIEDKLWVACFGGGCVLRIDPKTRKIMQKVDIPVTKVTSCCFGGPHFDTLYVTTANMGLSEEEKSKQPKAGAVFAISELGVRGQPAVNFIN